MSGLAHELKTYLSIRIQAPFMIICSKKLPESNLLAVVNTYARACVNPQPGPEAAECCNCRSAVIDGDSAEPS